MRIYLNYLHMETIALHRIYHPILLIEARRAKAFPIATKRLIAKLSDHLQASGARHFYDILPLFVALLDLQRHSGKLLIYPAVFVNRPHTEKSIYTNYGMSIMVAAMPGLTRRLYRQVAAPPPLRAFEFPAILITV